MGTSISQMSAKTLGWGIVQQVYKSDSFTVERAVCEIWRAATSETSNLKEQLASPIVNAIEEIALTKGNPSEIASEVEKTITFSGNANFACELARLAAIKAAVAPLEQRRSIFREKLFAEASNYLISRDISGYVGKEFRSTTISEMITFKRLTLESTSSIVRKSLSEMNRKNSWNDVVDEIVNNLRKRPTQ